MTKCPVCEYEIDPVTAPVHPLCAPRTAGDLTVALAALVGAGLITVEQLRDQGVLT